MVVHRIGSTLRVRGLVRFAREAAVAVSQNIVKNSPPHFPNLYRGERWRGDFGPLVFGTKPTPRCERPACESAGSTTREVQPVSCIEGHEYKPVPGPVTERLARSFTEYVRSYAAKEPAW